MTKCSDRRTAASLTIKIIMAIFLLIISVPSVQAEEQKSFVLNSDNPSFTFFESKIVENNLPITMEFNEANIILKTIKIPNNATILSATISLTTLNRYHHIFNCSNSCDDSEKCDAPSPENSSNWSCNYNSWMSIPFTATRGCNTPNAIKIGDYFYGGVDAGDSICKIDSGCTCESFGPKSCIGERKSCNKGDNISVDWWIETIPDGNPFGPPDDPVDIYRIPAIYRARWRNRDGWKCFDWGTHNLPIEEFYIIDSTKSVQMNYSYDLDAGIDNQQNLESTCPQNYQSEDKTNLTYPTPALDIGNNGADWTPGLQENEIEYNINIASVLQNYLNETECENDICEIPFNFTSETAGALRINNISISYSYSPEGVDKKAELNSKDIMLGDTIYKADRITFAKGKNQDILLKYYDIRNNSTTCWQDNQKKDIVEINENRVCDIEDINWDKNKTPVSMLIWSDQHELVEGPFYSSKDATVTPVTATSYKFSASVTFPNNELENSTVNVTLNLENFSNWNNSNNFTLYIEGNKTNYSINDKQLGFTFQSTLKGNYSIQIRYTIPPLKSIISSNSGVPEPPRSRGGGGRSSPNPEKETVKESFDIQYDATIGLLAPVSNEIDIQEDQVTTKSTPISGFLTLAQLKTPTSKIITGLIAGILIVVTLATRLEYKTSLPKLPKTKPSTPVIEPQLNKHMETILKGLSFREQEILKTIMKQDGHMTQARVYHKTGIPTTSLSRWMDTLERKGLVESSRRGKLRDLKVTTKFTGD